MVHFQEEEHSHILLLMTLDQNLQYLFMNKISTTFIHDVHPEIVTYSQLIRQIIMKLTIIIILSYPAQVDY